MDAIVQSSRGTKERVGGEPELNFTMGVFSHTSMDRKGQCKRQCSQWQAGLQRMSAKSGKNKKDRRVTTVQSFPRIQRMTWLLVNQSLSREP